MTLPPLVDNLSDALIDQVSVGPRREITLSFITVGSNGRFDYNCPVRVRFGGIKNLVEASGFFAEKPYGHSEVAWLRYAEQPRSKPGDLFLELVFERVDCSLVLHCSSLQLA